MNCYLTAILVFGVFMLFRETNGQNYCKDDNNTIRSCDGLYTSGKNIHVNLNSPCACTVIALFSGELLVTVLKDASYLCWTEVTVSLGTIRSVFNCERQYPSGIVFDINANETVVNVMTNYTASYSSGNFSYCLRINQNGGLGGTVSVTCGNSTTATTTKSTTTTTTTADKTTTTSATTSPSNPDTTTTTTAETLSTSKPDITTTTTAITTFPTKPETTTTTTAATTSRSKPETTTTTIAATTSRSKPETTTTTIAATTSQSKQETSSSTTTYNTTTVVDSSSQKSTNTSSDNVTYTIAGAAAGGLVLVVVVIVAITGLRKKKGGKNYQTQKTNEASEHTNRAFDENSGLPDNPLYHSAQPMDEVGYSAVQKNDLGLPPTEATMKKHKDTKYDIPTNNRPINDSDTSPMPIYAVPNKSGVSPPEENEPQAMYAQVSKPGKSTTQGPTQSANQDGLVYLKVEKDAISVNENTPYTHNGNKDSVLYAEIKPN